MAKVTYTYKQANLPKEALENINKAHDIVAKTPGKKVRKADLWMQATQQILDKLELDNELTGSR